MNGQIIKFDATIKKVQDINAAYVEVPLDIQAKFGKRRLPVLATFDGEEYQGSVVNMGIKNSDGSVCYIIGLTKDIRKKINKQAGDNVHVILRVRQSASEL